MAEGIIYPKGVVPRGDDFREAQKMRGEVYNFLKSTMEETVESAFSQMGYKQKAQPAGYYADGKAFGYGVDDHVYNVKVGSKTDSYLEKRIGLGGKRIVCELHMTIYPQSMTVEMHYKNTEDAAFRGFHESTGPYMINEKIIISCADMKKFKEEMTKKLKEFAEKEVNYITRTKLGNEDRMEKSTASVVEGFSLKSLFTDDFETTSQKIMEAAWPKIYEKDEEDLETDNLLLGDINEEEFIPHGSFATSNFGGYEIQMSDDGDGARLRYHGGEPTDWLEIEYDEEGNAYVVDPDNGDKLGLNNFMKVQNEVTATGGGAAGAGDFGYDAPLGAPRRRSLKTSAPFDQPVNENSSVKKYQAKVKPYLKEGKLSQKGLDTIKKWMSSMDVREVAQKLIDVCISKQLGGLTSSDLPDTMTFANGLDTVSEYLENNDFQEAWKEAKNTAEDMIREEGGGDIFETKNINELSPQTYSSAAELGLSRGDSRGQQIAQTANELNASKFAGETVTYGHPESKQVTSEKIVKTIPLKDNSTIKIQTNEGEEIFLKSNGEVHFYAATSIEIDIRTAKLFSRILQHYFKTIISPKNFKLLATRGATQMNELSPQAYDAISNTGQDRGDSRGKAISNTANQLKARPFLGKTIEFYTSYYGQIKKQIEDVKTLSNNTLLIEIDNRMDFLASPSGVYLVGEGGEEKVEVSRNTARLLASMLEYYFGVNVPHNSFQQMNESQRKFEDTPYARRLRENRRATNLRIIPEGKDGDGFWTVVDQKTLDNYKKNHIMGAPGAEGVEVNSKEEEEYNSGGVQKFPGGKSVKKEISESREDKLNKEYAEKYMQIDESVRKRYKPVREKSQEELNERWKRLATLQDAETIRLAESVTPDVAPQPKRQEKQTETEKGLQELSRNNGLEEGDTIDGKTIIEIEKPNCLAPVYYKVFKEDYENSSRAFIWDFNTGTLVNNPGFSVKK